MPRHILAPKTSIGERQPLTTDLVREIKAPRPMGQPIILEDGNVGGDSVRIQVVWDRWENVAGELRSAIILDAYATALGDEYRRKIKLALGMTVPEAVEVGLLPFQIMTARRRDEEPSCEEYRKAMIDAGASRLLGEDRPQLRFATLDDAEAAMEHLQDMLPKSRWIIAQEVSVAHSADAFLREA
jgi:hypothetical protein